MRLDAPRGGRRPGGLGGAPGRGPRARAAALRPGHARGPAVARARRSSRCTTRRAGAARSPAALARTPARPGAEHAKGLEQALSGERAPVATVPSPALNTALASGGPAFFATRCAPRRRLWPLTPHAVTDLRDPDLLQPLGSIMAGEGQHLVVLRAELGVRAAHAGVRDRPRRPRLASSHGLLLGSRPARAHRDPRGRADRARPERLPDAARSVGRGMREFRESLSGMTTTRGRPVRRARDDHEDEAEDELRRAGASHEPSPSPSDADDEPAARAAPPLRDRAPRYQKDAESSSPRAPRSAWCRRPS